MLHLQNIQKYYGAYLALQVTDLQLDTGIYWLKGNNGSGKTTLFKLIAGLLPFGGNISLSEQISIKKNPIQYRRLVNYSEAEPIFPSFISGKDLIHFYRQTKKANPLQIKDLIDIFQVAEFMEKPIGTYSSGMLKKMGLLLAFIGNPKVILLDEPLITLDVETVPKVYQLIQHYNQKQEVSFLLSSHQNFTETELSISQTLLIENQTVKYYTSLKSDVAILKTNQDDL